MASSNFAKELEIPEKLPIVASVWSEGHGWSK